MTAVRDSLRRQSRRPRDRSRAQGERYLDLMDSLDSLNSLDILDSLDSLDLVDGWGGSVNEVLIIGERV